MAKITDPEIIQALKDGKKVFYFGFTYSLTPDGYLWDEGRDNDAMIDMTDLEADDWQIVPDEASTT